MSEDTQGGGIDRRQFPRIEVDTSVIFSVILPSHEEGKTRDISQGGLCLETRRALPQGTILRLEFDLPGNPPEHISAVGKVMWQRMNVDGSFLTGVKFLS